MTFQEKLVKLRKLKGINQSELAAAVGVSRQAVYKWESGQSYPEVTKLIEIKALFNISIDDLLDENYEVVLPEKPKRRSRKAKEASINTETEINDVPVVEEEKITPPEKAPENVIITEAAPIKEETPTETPVEAPTVKAEEKEEPKKRGFFARLFGG